LKKALTYFFLMVFLANSYGTYLLIALNKADMKKEIAGIIAQGGSSQLVTQFTFPGNERYSSLEQGDEINHLGNSYDIISVKSKNGLVTINCIQDSKEDLLYKDLTKQGSNPVSGSKEHKQLSKTFAKKFISLNENTFKFDDNERKYYLNNTTTLIVAPIKVTTPPPKA
jgi:hypothetical protein